MKTKNKRWLLKGVITALLVGAAVAPTMNRKAVMKADALTNTPVVVGEYIGWKIGADGFVMEEEAPAGSDIYVQSFASKPSTCVQIVKQGTWDRFKAQKFDKANSNHGNIVFAEGDPNEANQNLFVMLPTTSLTVKLHNPDANELSPAGPQRITVDVTGVDYGGLSYFVLGGSAVGGWNTETDANRLYGIASSNGRYYTLTREFTAGGAFKMFMWKTWRGDFGWSSLDTLRSNAAGVLSQDGSDIKVNTGAEYMVVADTKTMKLYFHNTGTTAQTVSKYYGADLLEQEAAWSGISYHPTYVTKAGKRLEGWYTDPELTTKYVPGQVAADMNLYAKYVDNVDTKLTVFDRGEVLSTGDMYAYGWNSDGNQPLGGWPGTKMTKHGYGYHSVDVLAANVTENILFHNNAGGQTPDLVWEIGKNLYGHDGENYVWGVMSAVHHEATLFAIRILHETRLCDATGAANNVPADKWTELAGEFNALTTEAKADLKNAVANVNGDLVAQAVARYDYVVQKYGVATFANFMDRVVAPAPARQPIVVGEHRTMLVAGSFGIMAFVALAGFTILAKKRRNK